MLFVFLYNSQPASTAACSSFNRISIFLYKCLASALNCRNSLIYKFHERRRRQLSWTMWSNRIFYVQGDSASTEIFQPRKKYLHPHFASFIYFLTCFSYISSVYEPNGTLYTKQNLRCLHLNFVHTHRRLEYVDVYIWIVLQILLSCFSSTGSHTTFVLHLF